MGKRKEAWHTMKKEDYTTMENYMLSCMEDSAHDKEHIYRVLYNALDIAQTEERVDYDILISACLLHDVGRKEQFENPSVCHAMAGAEKAYVFLKGHGFPEEYAAAVRDCIRSHRFRKSDPPQSIEAKILFDADKIDVSGAIGIARTLVYKGKVAEPLYTLQEDGQVSDGSGDGQYQTGKRMEPLLFFRNININWKEFMLVFIRPAVRKWRNSVSRLRLHFMRIF